MFYELIVTLFIFGPLFYLRVVKNQSWDSIRKELLGKYKGHWKEAKGALMLCGLLLLGFVAVMIAITAVEAASGASINDLGNVQQVVKEEFASGIWVYLGTMAVVVFAEEFLFRAFLVPRIGIFPSTIIFSAFHFGYGSVAEIIGVFALGLILAWWYRKNRSIYQNYAGHMLYNLIAVALYAFF